MTFDDAVTEFRYWLISARGRSQLTASSYESDLKQFANLAKIKKLTHVRRPAVIAWAGKLKEAEFSERTKARKLSALKTFVGWATEYHHLGEDPVPIELHFSLGFYLPDALSEGDVRSILDMSKRQTESLQITASGRIGELQIAASIRDRAILEVLYASGMRVSELCGLRREDLHFGEGFAMVTGKGNKQRLVPLGHYAIEALQAYFTQREVLCKSAPQHAEVFLSQRGPISRSQVFRIIKNCAARAGITGKVSPHTFRHSCASHLLAHGADLRLVQELLGHSALSTTQVYTHIEKSRLRKVYDECHPMA